MTEPLVDAMKDRPFGTELILDLHGCERADLGRESVQEFLINLCATIGMVREDVHYWDYHGDPEGYASAPAHLKGTSVVQFIRTSTVVVHILDDLRRVYINVFSCQPFDPEVAVELAERFWLGYAEHWLEVERK